VGEKIKLIRQHLLEIQNNNDVIIAEKKERLKGVFTQLEEMNVEYDGYEVLITELEQSLTEENRISGKMTSLETLRHQIKAKLNLLNKEIKFFSEHDSCPTCQRVIGEEFQCEAIATRSSSIDEINAGLEQLEVQYNATLEKFNKISGVHAEMQKNRLEMHKLRARIESLEEYENTLNEEIKSIKKTNEERDDSKLIDLEKELKDLDAKSYDLEEDRVVLGAAGSLLKDGGIKSRIIKQYVPIINRLINKYLAAMEFLVQFELDEEFNETIKSRFRDEFSYSSFSEGEKMRINLAILFTWRAVAKMRNSINTNILIMDEVFDSSLDSTGTEEFMKILNQLTVDTNTFIISHKTDQISDKFDNVIKFEKKQNFSRIAS
jgi:chromosome segregation ATPase